MRFFRTLVAAALWGLFSFGASAQSVQQSGTITVGQPARWVSNGVIGAGGAAADGLLTTLGVTNANLSSFCISSARASAAGRNQMCFGAQTNGAAVISLQNYGTATAQELQFNINGTTLVPSGISGSPATNSMMCAGSANSIQSCGLLAASGIITSGSWNGTEIAVVNGGTGATTAAAARTNLGLGTMAVQAASAVAITGGTITGMANPSAGSDVANKTYVDGIASGITIHTAARLTTAAVLPQTPTYANGASGVGATLTAGSNAALVVDGVTVVSADRVVVKNQATAANNGVYSVTTVGDGSTPWVLTRATDFDTAAEMLIGSYFFTTAGSVNSGSAFVLAATVSTVGSTAATFNLYSTVSGVTTLGGSSGAISLGTGLSISSSTLVSSALSNVRVAITTGTTIDNTSTYKTKSIAAGGSAFYTLTFGAASGFDSDYAVRVTNEDTGRGKLVALSGVASFMLWPGQTTVIWNSNAAWKYENPGRWITSSAPFKVTTTGNDNNDCLGTGSGACLTIQAAVNKGCDFVDGGVTVDVADGTYTAGVALAKNCLGLNGIAITGNTSTPTNVVLSINSGYGFDARDKAILTVDGFTLTPSGSSVIAVNCTQLAIIDLRHFTFHHMASGYMMVAADLCKINVGAGIAIVDNIGPSTASSFAYASGQAQIAFNGNTIPITGTWTIGSAACLAQNLGSISMGGGGFSGGTVFGTRYQADTNATILGGVATCPGSVAGVAVSGGQVN